MNEIEQKIITEAVPPLVSAGAKKLADLFDLGKTNRELTATREELARKDEIIADMDQRLNASQTRAVIITEDLAKAREKLSKTQYDFDAYREFTKYVMLGEGIVIILLFACIIVLVATRQSA